MDERLVFSWTLLGLSHRTTSPGSVVATLLLISPNSHLGNSMMLSCDNIMFSSNSSVHLRA